LMQVPAPGDHSLFVQAGKNFFNVGIHIHENHTPFLFVLFSGPDCTPGLLSKY